MNNLLIISLLFLSSCGRADEYKVYMALEGNNYSEISRAYSILRQESNNKKLKSGTEHDHNIIIKYATNEQLVEKFGKNVLGVALYSGDFCEIYIADRTFKYGRDLVVSVVWHEIGHCVGLGHSNDSRNIMYKYSYPITSYSQQMKEEFFRGLYEATH
ncbi:hypothetical protein EB118_04305 [bacterium]|nr:hypothetical protein [bacterium]